jgi:hypothetical protein
MSCCCPFDIEEMFKARRKRMTWWRGFLSEDGVYHPKPTTEELKFLAWAIPFLGKGICLVIHCGDRHVSDSEAGESVFIALREVQERLEKCRDPRPWYERQLAEASS